MTRGSLFPAISLLLLTIALGVVVGNPLTLYRFLEHGPYPSEGGNGVTSAPAPKPHHSVVKYVRVEKPPAKSLTVAAGQRVVLECEVWGNPFPRVFWLSGNDPKKQLDDIRRDSVPNLSLSPEIGPIMSVVSKHVINCAAPTDTGLKHCAAIAGEKDVISPPTDLTVTGEASGNGCNDRFAPIITLVNDMVLSTIGYSTVLHCQATGNPRPTTSWKKMNELGGNDTITEGYNSRYTILETGDLEISNLLWEDMGGYYCIANNELGTISAGTFLYPAKPNSEKKQ